MALDMFEESMARVEEQMVSVAAQEVPRVLRDIPLEVFGRLLLGVPDRFPHLTAWLPSMAADAVQDSWTGAHGEGLLGQSLAFVRTMTTMYPHLTGGRVHDAEVLDFGCGWGRLIRLMYKYVPWTQLHGVDPWDEAIRQCQLHKVKAHLALSDDVPRTLPFDGPFDLIYAFSVFTHLSEKTAEIVLDTLRGHITAGGLLVMTVRPPEYWRVHGGGSVFASMTKAHEERGFAFTPHRRALIEGDITYGDTSMSLDYIRTRYPAWRLEGIEWNAVDPYQVILLLRPR